jgi:serine/threonine protein kinase
MLDAAQGIQYLHSLDPPLIHGDVKAVRIGRVVMSQIPNIIQANLLVDENGQVKVSDFGLIAVSDSFAAATSFSASAYSGSVRWLAPEHFDYRQKINKDRKTDIYAFSMTLWEVRRFGSAK